MSVHAIVADAVVTGKRGTGKIIDASEVRQRLAEYQAKKAKSGSGVYGIVRLGRDIRIALGDSVSPSDMTIYRFLTGGSVGEGRVREIDRALLWLEQHRGSGELGKQDLKSIHELNSVIIDKLLLPMYVIAASGRILDVRAGIKKSVLAEEVVGKNILDMFDFRQQAQFQSRIFVAMQTGIEQVFELTINTIEGLSHYKFAIVPLNESELLTWWQDITKEVQRIERMEAELRGYRAVLENVNTAFMRTSATLTILYASPQILLATQLSLADMVGKSLLNFVHPSSGAGINLLREKLIQGKPGKAHFGLMASDGSVKSFEIVSQPVRGSAPTETAEYVHSFREVDMELEGYLEDIRVMLYYNESVAVLTAGSDWRIRHATKGVLNILQAEPEALVGKSIWELVPNKTEVLARLGKNGVSEEDVGDIRFRFYEDHGRIVVTAIKKAEG